MEPLAGDSESFFKKGVLVGMVLNVKEVAEYLGVHPQTIRNYIRKNTIPHKRMGGRNSRILFSKKAIDEWIYEGEGLSCANSR